MIFSVDGFDIVASSEVGVRTDASGAGAGVAAFIVVVLEPW
jgi:hypothetical protein